MAPRHRERALSAAGSPVTHQRLLAAFFSKLSPPRSRDSSPEPPLTEQPSRAFALDPSAPKEISKKSLPPAQPLIELRDVFGETVS
ncbi:hypothetical protein llap_14235 [Limosa lapponica baueri]|uniref:Uncharacterized protein n=1 Tax=Limosa lapponica baueri TaxID=1758121 RepID=A0A2I0TNV5_LIMLA|nr:hypothetical protein llap_14235 [Limosa lapponica baueri]